MNSRETPPQKVLVDTSVWVNFFRGDRSTVKELEYLMDSGRVVICGLVKQEVLQGSRDRKALEKLEKEMAIWRYEAERPPDFVQAAKIFARLRWRGITIPPSDCLIAAVALRAGLQLYADDDHFQHVEGLTHYHA